MTLPSSGPLSIGQINGEFGRGNNLAAYRGVQWFTDAGGSGYFTNTDLGINQFYGKRASQPFWYFSGTLNYQAPFIGDASCAWQGQIYIGPHPCTLIWLLARSANSYIEMPYRPGSTLRLLIPGVTDQTTTTFGTNPFGRPSWLIGAAPTIGGLYNTQIWIYP